MKYSKSGLYKKLVMFANFSYENCKDDILPEDDRYHLKITNDSLSIDNELHDFFESNELYFQNRKDDGYVLITRESFDSDFVKVTLDDNGESTSDAESIQKIREMLDIKDDVGLIDNIHSIRCHDNIAIIIQ